jgi:RNA recognition motif-containing protein
LHLQFLFFLVFLRNVFFCKEFEKISEAEEAIKEMDRKEFNGRIITVQEQKSRNDRDRDRGRGGGGYNRGDSRNGECYNCGSKDHMSYNCDRRRDRDDRSHKPLSSSRCYTCGEMGLI